MTEIRAITPADLPACAALLVDAYNGEPWNDHWTQAAAERYLAEFLGIARFQGFLLFSGGEPAGALFGHGRAWWTGDEFYIDEFYIATAHQRKGLGGALLRYTENYMKSLGLNGITLLTNRHFPARDFYLKNGFEEAEHVLFLYKILK
jgi:aminoglycoside 6'-N-acetyltransferase I